MFRKLRRRVNIVLFRWGFPPLFLLALGCSRCTPPPPPTEPDPPEKPNRGEQCLTVCELMHAHQCAGFGVCLEFGEAAEDGTSECIAYDRTIPGCVSDCVSNPGAYPADLTCPATLTVTGPDADARWCAALGEVCPIPMLAFSRFGG